MSEETKEKRVSQVVQAGAAKRKTPVSEKIAKTFFKAENVTDIKDYLMHDVVIPAIVDAIVDFIQKGTNMLFYGDARSGSTKRSSNRNDYNRISTLGGSSRRREEPRRNTSYDKVYRGYESVFLESRGDAEEVIDNLVSLMDDYKMVSVADLYELVGLPSQYTDNKWGWYDIHRAQIRRVRGGWTIDLPEPEPLD